MRVKLSWLLRLASLDGLNLMKMVCAVCFAPLILLAFVILQGVRTCSHHIARRLEFAILLVSYQALLRLDQAF
jgi:hypothetical protein